MGRVISNYDIDKEILDSIRKNKILFENKEDKSIAITNDVKFGGNLLNDEIDNFKQAVHSGAKFSKDEGDVSSKNNALVYFPETGNVVFSGSIPVLNDLKFQFSLNDLTRSPYVFVDGLTLTEETIETLNKLRGYYLNWCEEWQNRSDLLDSLKNER